MTGPPTCHSSRNKPFSERDESVGDYIEAFVPTKGSSISTHTPAMSRVPTFAPAPPLALGSGIPVARYTDKDLQRATQLTLNLFI